MAVFDTKMNTFVYGVGVEHEHPKDDLYDCRYGVFGVYKDYIFTTNNFRVAKVFYSILENFNPRYEKFEFSDPVESYDEKDIVYTMTFTCSEKSRIQLEYILRSGMGYAFIYSKKLLKGRAQGYSIVEWE